MKYMTFNSSCSYAGVANMLERYGLETSDRSIALAMKLPYLFSCRNGAYLSGPMLQTAEWFDLYLNPIGYQLVEKRIPFDEVIDYLKAQKTAMLGIKMNAEGKHAVVYVGMEDDRLVFLNNKWESEESPGMIRLTAEELKQRIDVETAVATLRQITPREVDFTDKLVASVAVVQANLSEIIALCHTEETVDFLRSKLNTLFRPLFLDGITMLDLIGETELAADFANMQRGLLCALRQEADQSILLREHISADKLCEAVGKYIGLIKAEIAKDE